MTVSWLLSKDVFSEDSDGFTDELFKRAMPYKVVDYSTFVDSSKYYTIFPEDSCVVYYGSLFGANCVQRCTNWTPGVIYNKPNYYCSAYYPVFGDLLLNQNYIMMPLGDLFRRQQYVFDNIGDGNNVFIRPNSGHKLFNGEVWYRENLEQELSYLDGKVDFTSIVVLAEPKNILAEWRFFVVDSKVITGSRYKLKTRLSIDRDCPTQACELAMEAAKLYNPDRAWSLDICLTGDGYKILEIGCFACSGLYACDKATIIDSIAKIAKEEYLERLS